MSSNPTKGSIMFKTHTTEKAGINYGSAVRSKVRRNMPLQLDRLKAARKERKYTQQEMANRLRVTQPQYADWERGRYEPAGETVAEMASILSVTSDFLYGLVDNPDETLKEAGLSDFELQVVRVIRKDEVKRYYVAKLLDLPAQPPALPSSNESDNEPQVSG